MFKAGDLIRRRVRHHNPGPGVRYTKAENFGTLTVGKVYEVLSGRGDVVVLKDDKGRIGIFGARNFEQVKE